MRCASRRRLVAAVVVVTVHCWTSCCLSFTPLVESWIKEHPRSPSARALLNGFDSLCENQLASALGYFQLALEHAPKNHQVHDEMGLIVAKTAIGDGKFETARLVLSHVKSADHDDIGWQDRRAGAKLELAIATHSTSKYTDAYKHLSDRVVTGLASDIEFAVHSIRLVGWDVQQGHVRNALDRCRLIARRIADSEESQVSGYSVRAGLGLATAEAELACGHFARAEELAKRYVTVEDPNAPPQRMISARAICILASTTRRTHADGYAVGYVRAWREQLAPTKSFVRYDYLEMYRQIPIVLKPMGILSEGKIIDYYHEMIRRLDSDNETTRSWVAIYYVDFLRYLRSVGSDIEKDLVDDIAGRLADLKASPVAHLEGLCAVANSYADIHSLDLAEFYERRIASIRRGASIDLDLSVVSRHEQLETRLKQLGRDRGAGDETGPGTKQTKGSGLFDSPSRQ